VRKNHGINIMAIKKNSVLDMEITPETVFIEDQPLLVLGKFKQVKKCFKIT